MRLFVALLLPDCIKIQLSQAQTHLKPLGLRGNYTTYDNMHMTLVFIGDVSIFDVEVIEHALSDVNVTPFTLSIAQLDCFYKRSGDIWWCAIEHNLHLIKLQTQITQALNDYDIAFEKRPFKPHITIARQFKAKSNTPLVLPLLEKLSVEVTSFALMESTRIKGDLVYRPIAIFD